MAVIVGVSRLTYNVSPSLPTGFYWLDSPEVPVSRGDVVSLKPPPPAASLLASRGYLPRGYYLLKRVVAVPGDRVCFEDCRFVVNDAVLAPIPLSDSQGRPLAPSSFCGRIPEGSVAVATPYPKSFDSRFFGPVPMAGLRRAHRLFAKE